MSARGGKYHLHKNRYSHREESNHDRCSSATELRRSSSSVASVRAATRAVRRPSAGSSTARCIVTTARAGGRFLAVPAIPVPALLTRRSAVQALATTHAFDGGTRQTRRPSRVIAASAGSQLERGVEE